MVQLFFLKTFLDAARTGSLSAAAKKNFVTQPAVTQQVRVLEGKLGCRLFERGDKKLRLTPAGRELMARAEHILREYERARSRISEISGRPCGTLRLATIYSIGLYELQDLIGRFIKDMPEIDIHLEYQTFDKIYGQVAKREVDLGFVAFPSKPRIVIAETFRRERMVLVQSCRQRVIAAKRADFKDLERAKFVAFAPHTPTRQAIDRVLGAHGCRPAVVNEFDDIETLKSAVLMGLGCSILPEICVRREVAGQRLEILPLDGFTLERPLAVLHRKGAPLSLPARLFRERCLKKCQ